MSVSYIDASGTASNVNADGTVSKANQNVAQNQFLQLLITELKNQDPTKPTDQTQTLSQLAQFSSLEQMTNLNQNITQGNTYSQISQSAALIGKTVTTSSDSRTGQHVRRRQRRHDRRRQGVWTSAARAWMPPR